MVRPLLTRGPMDLRRGSACLLASFVVVACAGGPGAAGEQSGPSGAPAGAGGSDDAEGLAVSTDGLTKVRFAVGYCGGAPGKCYGRRSAVADLTSATLTHRSCVERGNTTDDEETSRTLTTEEIERIRAAVANLRYERVEISSYDGVMEGVILEHGGRRQELSPEKRCGTSPYDRIVSGLGELAAALGETSQNP